MRINDGIMKLMCKSCGFTCWQSDHCANTQCTWVKCSNCRAFNVIPKEEAK